MLKVKFSPKILKKYFSYKVREFCKSCKRYGYKVCCPPYIESVDYYKELLPSFKYGILVFKKFIIDDLSKWEELGRTSSLDIYNELFKMRTQLLNKGKFGIIYGAGSCKICSTCSSPCRFPNKKIIPLEGTGVNIVKLMKDLTKINLKYPVKKYKYFYRVGVILYD